METPSRALKGSAVRSARPELRLSPLLIFFAVLGGLSVFGVLGIILGPVVFAVAGSLLEVLSGEDEARAVPTPTPEVARADG